jgi:hypothetical protein
VSVLQEQGQERKTMAEILEFIQPGDLGLLENIALDSLNENARDKRTAVALPSLLFLDSPTSPAFQHERGDMMREAKDVFESQVRSDANIFEFRQSLTDLMQAAENFFLLRSVVNSNISRPTDETWEVIQRKIREFAGLPLASPSSWLVKLMYIDPVRFKTLPAEELRHLCLENIAEERREHPIDKDKRQMRLLHALANTRLMFPDLVDAFSLSSDERAVTRTYLASERAYCRDEGGSSFAFYLYLLSVVEAPGIKVDEQGVHLYGEKTLGRQSPDLPSRQHI